jgi:hypothetical protein
LQYVALLVHVAQFDIVAQAATIEKRKEKKKGDAARILFERERK